MNRRQFLGAQIAATIAAFALPFERFAEWCRTWLRAPSILTAPWLDVELGTVVTFIDGFGLRARIEAYLGRGQYIIGPA